MAVAFGLGIWVAMKRAEARGLGGKFALDLAVLILIFSLIGARVTYVVTHWREFADHPLDAISPIQHTGQIGIAGLVLLGGVIAGFITVWVYRGASRSVSGHDDLLFPPPPWELRLAVSAVFSTAAVSDCRLICRGLRVSAGQSGGDVIPACTCIRRSFTKRSTCCWSSPICSCA